MATLPASTQTSPTVQAIYSMWASRIGQPRAYLGGSVLGRECERALWYGFRWAYGGDQFDGRMLRLFDRGQREEAAFVADLRGIGCTVHDTDPGTGGQFRFKACSGHAGGGIDGVVQGVPEAPRAWHLVEMKTHNAKSFAALEKDGVAKSKPEHWAQMQIYMRWASLDRALYLAVNKDNDSLYSERVYFDADAAAALEAKADRVIFAAEPLPGISEDPAFFKCKLCPAAKVCHTAALPPVSCRTCLHATPERDGDGRWSCARWGADVPLDAQRAGCDQHLYIPALMKRWGEAVDASEADGWVAYRAADGLEFRNGPWGQSSFTSRELAALSPELLRHPEFVAIRAKHAGVAVDAQWEDGIGDGAVYRWHYYADPATSRSHRHLGRYTSDGSHICWIPQGHPDNAKAMQEADAHMDEARGEFAPRPAPGNVLSIGRDAA